MEVVQTGIGVGGEAQLECWLPVGVQPGVGLKREAQLERWLPIDEIE
jgi:hypothetical protein